MGVMSHDHLFVALRWDLCGSVEPQCQCFGIEPGVGRDTSEVYILCNSLHAGLMDAQWAHRCPRCASSFSPLGYDQMPGSLWTLPTSLTASNTEP